MATSEMCDGHSQGDSSADIANDPYGPSDPNSTGVYFAPKEFRYSSTGSELAENDHCVSVLAVGEKILYVLPGFDVLSIELRHILIKGTPRIGRPEETYDLFVRNDFDLSRSYPCEMILKEVTIVKVNNFIGYIVINRCSIKYMYVFIFCLSQEDDFKLSVVSDNLQLPPQGVIVIWEWEWKEYEAETSSPKSDITHVSETSFGNETDETYCSTEGCSTEEEPPPEFTVTFKCIGTQHDLHAQAILKKVSQLLQDNQEVPVNIYPEPDNPFDSKAIAFKCWLDNDWHRIGYIVREALDSVHEAMDSGTIMDMKFAWARYLITWMRSGPGYYAGINITKRGQWSAEVRHSASTR